MSLVYVNDGVLEEHNIATEILQENLRKTEVKTM